VTSIERVCGAAKAASRTLARMSSHRKGVVLREMADAIERRAGEILHDNAEDVAQAKREHAPPPVVDRLYLDEDSIADMAACIRRVAELPDPVGEIDHGWRLANGLQIARQRVPLGVVAIVYEGRPNVTSDAAALCLKSGNAVILRGSHVAYRSNRILAEVLTGALIEAEAPPAAISLLGTDREELRQLVRMEGMVDLVVPRGGPGLKAFLLDHARVPLVFASAGNNHVYVDADADLEMALKITVNAKVPRPGVCNAAETLLVHRDVAAAFLPRAVDALRGHGVDLRVCAEALAALGERAADLREATDEDFATEFLSLAMAVRVVESLDAAIEHVNRFGSGHSEAIVTRSLGSATEFQQAVDAACVYVNASTRFTDGAEFGMGAEIGSSTQKIHARGPIGLTELTTMKYLITGQGQVR
jgi:glutamate-5-semialdehyde dehydrogenase